MKPELAPCGVFCGACPSFEKSCFGCASMDRSQKRASKWGCNIRSCCYETKGLAYCMECSEFPCVRVEKKLLQTHPGDPRFQYRHEIPAVSPRLLTLGEEAYLQFQKERWTCKACGGQVVFYHYTCTTCGMRYFPEI